MNTEVQNSEELKENSPQDSTEDNGVSAEQAFAEAVGEEYKPPIDDIEEDAKQADQEEVTAAPSNNDPLDDKGEADEAPNPYGGLDQSVVEKIRMDAVKEAEKQFSGRIRNLEGHIGGLKQKLDGMAEQMKVAKSVTEDAGGDAPTQRQINDAIKDGEKMAALRTDFPEFAEALDEMAANFGGNNSFQSELQETRQAAAQATAQLAEMREIRILDKAHSDWEEVVNTDSYQNWLANQPENIQDVANNSPHARDAIAVLSMYKEATTSHPDLTASSRQNNQDRLEKATAPTSGKNVNRRQPITAEQAFLIGAGEA
ncbi:MAG: hypothetical protein KDA17_04650 [Candidatus Saccharibacteria bacterium]|nr:hypothetical protein [Candidatus Saccharibacteria bacterium]